MWTIKRILTQVSIATALVMALAACGGGQSEVVTHTDSKELTLFKAPVDWNIYNASDLVTLESIPFQESVQGLEFPSVEKLAFDASPAHNVANIGIPLAAAPYPLGSSTVRSIGETQREFMSRFVLSQSIIPYFTYTDPQEIAKEDFTFGSGFDGVRILVSYQDPESTDVGVAYFVSVTDADDRRMYQMVAGCSFECFREHQQTITQVVDSWLVNIKS